MSSIPISHPVRLRALLLFIIMAVHTIKHDLYVKAYIYIYIADIIKTHNSIHSTSGHYPGQDRGGSRGCPGNTGGEVGIQHGWGRTHNCG